MSDREPAVGCGPGLVEIDAESFDVEVYLSTYPDEEPPWIDLELVVGTSTTTASLSIDEACQLRKALQDALGELEGVSKTNPGP